MKTCAEIEGMRGIPLKQLEWTVSPEYNSDIHSPLGYESASFTTSVRENTSNPTSEDWFHPSVNSIGEVTLALVENSHFPGTFMITNTPTDGDSKHILLVRGNDKWDIFQSEIYLHPKNGGFVLSGI